MFHTGVFEQVVGVDDDGLLSELFGDELEHLVQFLEADLTGLEVIPPCHTPHHLSAINGLHRRNIRPTGAVNLCWNAPWVSL